MLNIDGSFSLKAKRSVVRKVIMRVKNRFPVSIAEVDEQDVWNHAVVGFAVVGNTADFVHSVIHNVLNYIDTLGVAVIEDVNFDILHY